MSHQSPKISVLIHFLNAAKYLPQAIDSVLRQTFSAWELILVDGGSNDDSVAIAKHYQTERPDQIRVLEHAGATTLGIFSSRIWGAEAAHAPILALLDSDDEWHPQFLERHYAIYQHVFAERPGMVYCPVAYWWEDAACAAQSYVQPIPPSGLHEPPTLLIPFLEDGYQRSAANSAVMIARELVLQVKPLIGMANEGMVEDQYLWSCLLTRMPVFVNPEPLVRYRQWGGSTCSTTIKTDKAKALREVHLRWLREHLRTSYHGDQQGELLQRVTQLAQREYPFSEQPQLEHTTAPPISPCRQAIQRGKRLLRDLIKPHLPEKSYRCLQQAYRVVHDLVWFTPKMPLRRAFRLIKTRIRFAVKIAPLSEQWGYDRGVPVLRYYTEAFLREYMADIRGHCLEFQEDTYTSRFGGSHLERIDILHHDHSNPKATLVADLTQPNTLAGDQFDCIICTFVLHVIFNVEDALIELHRLLKTGGTLLIAAPHISMRDPQAGELWRFTPEGLRRLLANIFGPDNVTIRSYGNALTAAGNVRGLAADEFTQHELHVHDDRFASVVCARAVKTTDVHQRDESLCGNR